jgi:hypothetical protein
MKYAPVSLNTFLPFYAKETNSVAISMQVNYTARAAIAADGVSVDILWIEKCGVASATDPHGR